MINLFLPRYWIYFTKEVTVKHRGMRDSRDASTSPVVLRTPGCAQDDIWVVSMRFHLLKHSQPLVVKSVAKLGVNLPGIVPVKAAERQTVIQLHPAVGHI